MTESTQRLFISFLLLLLLEQQKVLTIGLIVYVIAAIIQELYTSQELYTGICRRIRSYIQPRDDSADT
jgi:hypothetical protein